MLRRALCPALTLAALLCATSCGPAPETPTFVALAADFQNYHGWQRFDLGQSDALGHSVGHRVVYLNRLPPPGATEFPVGTILLKAMEDNADPAFWELFAMVRRGGNFNPDGLAGWEYFLLQTDASGAVTIEGRGVDPQGADSYGGFGSAGAGCDQCHGTPAARARSGLLSNQVYNSTLGAVRP